MAELAMDKHGTASPAKQGNVCIHHAPAQRS
ncbi:hypothetical protein F0726_02490 [Acidithiobacillus caldus]|nr:hypothetical protein F0726_02490 [Acidithiobacillus caldus]